MPKQVWSVQEAKAKFSELLRRAREGAPQYVGRDGTPCVLISAAVWEEMQASAGEPIGAWLVRNAPRTGGLTAPSRKSKRSIPFGDDDA